MAFSVNMIWEIRSAGTADAGAGFLSGASGTDRSQQDAVHASFTDLVIDGATNTKMTSAATPFAADDVGNVVNITSGSGWTVQRVEIISVASAVATCDKSLGTLGSTGGNGKLGGAISTMTDAFFEAFTAGNVAWIKQDGTHSTTGSISVAKDGTPTAPMRIDGYKTTRGDALNTEGNRPTIAFGANISTFDNFWRFHNLIITTTTGNGFDMDQNCFLYNCKITNTSAVAGRNGSRIEIDSSAERCEFISDKGNGLRLQGLISSVKFCYFHDCDPGGTNSGLLMLSGSDDGQISNCIFDTCANGITVAASEQNTFAHLTFYNCGEGMNMSTPSSFTLSHSIFDNCTTGLSRSASITTENPDIYRNLNFSNNTTDKTNIGTVTDETTLDPGFVDAANGDFDTGSNMDFTFAYPGGLTSTTMKLGAVQAAGGGGGSVNLLSGKVGG